MIPVTVNGDLHSSDFTASCLHEMALKRQGHYIADMPRAMYRGNWAGKVLEHLHRDNHWDDDSFVSAVRWATTDVQDDLVKEKRQLTQSVIDNREAIHKETAKICQQYMIRFGPRFKECKLIGCELPIRWTLEHPSLDKPASCASHLDLLFRDPKGVWGRGENRLIWWDWKYREEVPTFDYLGRNQQFIMYQLGLYEGQVMIGDDWIDFGEWAASAWIHLPNFKVYEKKTKGKDDDGNPCVYLKGDSRPDRSIIRWTNFRRDRAPQMKEPLAVRARMVQLDLHPTNPSPIGCSICQSRDWCERFDIGATP